MRVYLDNNATTPTAPELLKTIHSLSADIPLNPNSPHTKGQKARKLFEQATAKVLETLELKDYKVVFFGSASEAIHCVLTHYSKDCGVITSSAIEHSSMRTSASQLFTETKAVHIAQDGSINGSELTHKLQNSSLASFMYANNETGLLLPVASISEICEKAKVPLFLDCCQAPGKSDFFSTIKQLRPSVIVLSGHKIHTPVGIAALLFRNDSLLADRCQEGQQQYGLRPGTEPVLLASCFAEALALAKEQENLPALQAYSDQLWKAIQSAASHAQLTIKNPSKRLANTLHYRIPGLSAERQLIAFDLAGIECSSTSACESGAMVASKVLMAMGYNTEEAKEGIRLALNRYTTEKEINFACEQLSQCLEKLLRSKASS